MHRSQASQNLAAAFLAGTWSLDTLLRQGVRCVGSRPRWLRPLVRRILQAFPEQPTCRPEEVLTAFIDADQPFAQAWEKHQRTQEVPLRQLFWVTPAMSPASGAPAGWKVPALPTTTALASWLGLTPAQLDWFADVRDQQARLPPGLLRHYTYRWLPKTNGRWRLLEVPRPRLKSFQRDILREILENIPPHDAAHAYRPGRSIVTCAAPHCAQRIVLRFDLHSFFPSVRAARIHQVFLTAGYPRDVARLLTGLCTSTIPQDAWPASPDVGPSVSWEDRKHYRFAHLPQGAPTSPALANLCAYRLDCRLHGLARKFGARYTRYADDLAFSGGRELERAARGFQVQVCLIALEEGFEVNTRKTRFMRQGVRQQLLGIVVGSHPNVVRERYDQLKAILHNCIRYGPASQNRASHADFRSHLLGRVAHVAQVSPARGQRLQEMFGRISWEPGTSPQDP